MDKPSRKIIGENVKSIRKLLNLSQLEFSIITGLSKPSIINIESGNTGYNLDLLEKIISFSTYPLSELSKRGFIPAINLREDLIEKYKKNPIYNILNKQPSIVYAIKYKLLTSEFLNQFRETNEIKKYFEKLGWQFHGPSITNALTRMPSLIECKKHDSKINTNLYRRKNR